MRPAVAYVAAGAGLGHLQRGAAILQKLSAMGVSSVLVTQSEYADGVAAGTGLRVVRIVGDWAEGVRKYLDESGAGAVATDAFPFGWRGELAGFGNLVYVARRLQVSEYLRRVQMPVRWDGFRGVIGAEPLGEELEALLGEQVRQLKAPVRAEAAKSAFVGERIVVHSGPEEEVRELVAMAGGAGVTVVSPRRFAMDEVRWAEHYPAEELFAGAEEVYSGAGYNMMAGMGPWREKHRVKAFWRRFDLQEERVGDAFFLQTGDGAGEAAALLANWV